MASYCDHFVQKIEYYMKNTENYLSAYNIINFHSLSFIVSSNIVVHVAENKFDSS